MKSVQPIGDKILVKRVEEVTVSKGFEVLTKELGIK